jgi:hypothetical protein
MRHVPEARQVLRPRKGVARRFEDVRKRRVSYRRRIRIDFFPSLTTGCSGYLGGNCWGNSVGLGCGVMVDPNVKGCYRTGAVMQGAYDHIRNAGCPRCGSVQDDDNRGDACGIKIDYVSKCGNRASGVGP